MDVDVISVQLLEVVSIVDNENKLIRVGIINILYPFPNLLFIVYCLLPDLFNLFSF